MGGGDVGNDLNDEGTISRTAYARSNAALFVQILLWSQDLLPNSEVDCNFGPNTENAVKALQRRLNSRTNAGLTVDGKMGPATFTAYSRMAIISMDSNNRISLMPWSSNSPTGLLRRSNTTWQINGARGGWVDISYTSASAC